MRLALAHDQSSRKLEPQKLHLNDITGISKNVHPSLFMPKITHYTVVIIIMLDSGAEMVIYFQDYLELLKDYKLFHVVIRNQDIRDIVVYGHQIGMNHAHTGIQSTLSSFSQLSTVKPVSYLVQCICRTFCICNHSQGHCGLWSNDTSQSIHS